MYRIIIPVKVQGRAAGNHFSPRLSFDYGWAASGPLLKGHVLVVELFFDPDRGGTTDNAKVRLGLA